MKDGKSYKSFAAKLLVSVDTLYEWEKAHPEFSESRKIAQGICESWWEEQGRLGAWDEENGPKLNPSKWIFNMKARFGWRDKEPDIIAPVIQQGSSEDLKELKAMLVDFNRPVAEQNDTVGLLKK